MTWSYAIYDTLTGVRQASVTPASNTMSRLLNTGSSGTTVLPPSAELTRAQLRALTTPWARTLVKFWDDVPLFAHIITGRDPDYATGHLTLSHDDIWTLLARRTTFGTNGYSGDQAESNRLDLVDFSLAAIPAWLIWAGTEGPTANFGLPIYLPEGKITLALLQSIPHSGPEERSYFDYEIHFVESAIREILAIGPDADFEPEIVNGLLRWNFRCGTLTGGSSDWIMTAPQPALFDVSAPEDASKQANVVHAIGRGSERDMRVASAQAPPTVPALERTVNYKDIPDLSVLQQHANADLAAFNKPTKQWSASMYASAGKGIENMPLGHTFRLWFKDHWWEPDGWQNVRMIGMSTDASEKVTLTFQPSGGA